MVMSTFVYRRQLLQTIFVVISVASALLSISSSSFSCVLASPGVSIQSRSRKQSRVKMMFWKKFSTVDDVPSDYFSDNRYIYGFVERIIDGDTIRVRHVPGYGLRRQSTQPLQQRGIAKDTLSIRVYGVDTPEIGKNKRQVSQPFSEEAKSFTSKLVYNKMVKVTFLRKDQYSRAVASVETVPPRFLSWIPGFGPKDLSLELAKAGLAELYTGGGAQYNGKRAELEQAVAQAQRKKLGQWSLSESERVSAAEQKRLLKQAAVTGTAPVPVSRNDRSSGAMPLASTSRNGQTGVGESLLDAAVTGLEFM